MLQTKSFIRVFSEKEIFSASPGGAEDLWEDISLLSLRFPTVVLVDVHIEFQAVFCAVDLKVVVGSKK